MESNIINKECLKYSFCMLYQIYSLILNEECESYINLLLPFLYYLVTYKNVQKFLFEKFPKFKQLFCRINDKIKRKTEIDSKNNGETLDEEKKEENKTNDFEEILNSHLLNNEKTLIGFVPLKKYFGENKKSYKIYGKADQYEIKLFLLIKLLEELNCFPGNLLENEKENLLDDPQFILPLAEEDIHQVFNFISFD